MCCCRFSFVVACSNTVSARNTETSHNTTQKKHITLKTQHNSIRERVLSAHNCLGIAKPTTHSRAEHVFSVFIMLAEEATTSPEWFVHCYESLHQLHKPREHWVVYHSCRSALITMRDEFKSFVLCGANSQMLWWERERVLRLHYTRWQQPLQLCGVQSVVSKHRVVCSLKPHALFFMFAYQYGWKGTNPWKTQTCAYASQRFDYDKQPLDLRQSTVVVKMRVPRCHMLESTLGFDWSEWEQQKKGLLLSMRMRISISSYWWIVLTSGYCTAKTTPNTSENKIFVR